MQDGQSGITIRTRVIQLLSPFLVLPLQHPVDPSSPFLSHGWVAAPPRILLGTHLICSVTDANYSEALGHLNREFSYL